MCGIGALSRAEGRSSIPDARVLARVMAMRLEDRGRHATGFGWSENGWPHYWKMKGAASKVAQFAPLPSGMQTLIVHTRYATKGSVDQEVNNHPVVAPGLVLVHNGRVDNDDDVMKSLGYARMGQVDSEAIVALLSAGPAALGTDSIPDLLELVEGCAAIAWLDGAQPDSLHLARLATRPMELGWTKRGDLLMASTREALNRSAFLAADMELARYETIPEGTYLRVVAGNVVERKTFTPKRSKIVYGFDVPGRTFTTAGRSNLVPARSSGTYSVSDKGLRRRARKAKYGQSINDRVKRIGEMTDAEWESLEMQGADVYTTTHDDQEDMDAWWEAKMRDDPDLADVDFDVADGYFDRTSTTTTMGQDFERIFPGAAARDWPHDDLHALVESWKQSNAKGGK